MHVAEVEIGIFKSGRRAYGFDDIAIVPSRRTRDPEDVDISWEIDAYTFELPLLASAMDGVVSPATAIEIGRLKRDTEVPIYEPERERIVFENVQKMNPGPLPGREMVRIYERIMDVMRNIQKEGMGAGARGAETETEFDSDVND